MLSLGKCVVSLGLDLISIPGKLKSDEGNAKWHLDHVCPHCPQWRREMRDVDGDGECWWEKHWKEGDYDIPRDFGVWNWSVGQYLLAKTRLDIYRALSDVGSQD
jgi:hypothetical protein